MSRIEDFKDIYNKRKYQPPISIDNKMLRFLLKTKKNTMTES